MRGTINHLSLDEAEILCALEGCLDLAATTDWHLLHRAVRDGVLRGEYSAQLEKAYVKLVDSKLISEGV